MRTSKYRPKGILDSALLAASPWRYMAEYAESLLGDLLSGRLDLSEVAEWRAARGALARGEE